MLAAHSLVAPSLGNIRVSDRFHHRFRGIALLLAGVKRWVHHGARRRPAPTALGSSDPRRNQPAYVIPGLAPTGPPAAPAVEPRSSGDAHDAVV